MSIANSLDHSACLLRKALARNNGDIYEIGNIVLEQIKADIARVRALETVAPVYEKHLKALVKKGDKNAHTSN